MTKLNTFEKDLIKSIKAATNHRLFAFHLGIVHADLRQYWLSHQISQEMAERLNALILKMVTYSRPLRIVRGAEWEIEDSKDVERLLGDLLSEQDISF